MEEVVVYEKSTCSKCRVAIELLDESGIPFRCVRYHDEPLSIEKLTDLIRKLEMTPRELLRTSEPLYRKLGIAHANMSDRELIALMVKHPDLIQRPILERGDRAVLGRPTENITAFLSQRR